MTSTTLAEEMLYCYNKVRSTPLRLTTWAAAVYLQTEAHSVEIPPRGVLPEPFDYGEHQGNVASSLGAGFIVGNLVMRGLECLLPHASARTLRIGTLAGATAVGTALNVIFETRFGHKLVGEEMVYSLFGPETDTNLLDIPYGSLGSAAGSMAVVPNKDRTTPAIAPSQPTTGDFVPPSHTSVEQL